MTGQVTNRPSLWQAFGYGALGIALYLAGLSIGLLFLVLSVVSLWYYFHPPKSTLYTQQYSHPRDLENPETRLRQTQIPTQYLSALGDWRCFLCKSGIGRGQPGWLYNDEIGERRYMCGRCRDLLIVAKRDRVAG